MQEIKSRSSDLAKKGQQGACFTNPAWIRRNASRNAAVRPRHPLSSRNSANEPRRHRQTRPSVLFHQSSKWSKCLFDGDMPTLLRWFEDRFWRNKWPKDGGDRSSGQLVRRRALTHSPFAQPAAATKKSEDYRQQPGQSGHTCVWSTDFRVSRQPISQDSRVWIQQFRTESEWACWLLRIFNAKPDTQVDHLQEPEGRSRNRSSAASKALF